MIEKIVKATNGETNEIIKVRKPLGVFNLWCCDCNLRHGVWVEVRKEKTFLYMIPDFRATKEARRGDKLAKKLKKLKEVNKK